MTKKVFPLFVLITVAACLLSYKFGSAPVALAKGRAAQETSESAAPLTLPTAPATWTLKAYNPPQTIPATATRPAGGTGVKHVATCISFTYSVINGGNPGGSFLYLRNGPSLTGPILFQLIPQGPAGTTVAQSVCGLNIVGSPNTPMTLEYANGINASEVLNLVGYDAQ